MLDKLARMLSGIDADYADLRYEDHDDTSLEIRNTSITTLEANPTDGFFLRVLKNCGLATAAQLGCEPTATGFRDAEFKAFTPPMPRATGLYIQPGDSSLDDMISSIDYGVIAFGDLGGGARIARTGNYSSLLSPALLVDKGEIVGRVKDVMLTCNLLEAFARIRAFENRLRPVFWSHFPAILLDDIDLVQGDSSGS